jgi:hypothetical protein
MPGIAPEIRGVEGQDGGQAMHLHRGDKPRVMRGFACHLIAADQGLPGGIDRRRLGQQEKHALEPFQLHERGRGGQAQPVIGERPCGDGPELDKILRHDVERLALPGKNFEGAGRCFVLRVAELQSAQQCARVDQHARLEPVRVDAVAAHGFPPRHETAAPIPRGLFFADARWRAAVAPGWLPVLPGRR